MGAWSDWRRSWRAGALVGPLSGEPVALSGGITNHNFRVVLGGEDYVLRIHGKDTELLGIDRQSERLATELAAGLGIAPALAAAFDDCLLTRFIACDAVGASEVAESFEQIALALRSFHHSPAQLPSRFWVPDLLERYAALVRARHVELPDEYRQAAAVAPDRRRRAPARPAALPQRPAPRQHHPRARRRRDADRRLGVRRHGPPLLRPRQPVRQQRLQRGPRRAAAARLPRPPAHRLRSARRSR